jgi:murein DD-endopeptidase MepM/ murein hydrolase activator NlpD
VVNRRYFLVILDPTGRSVRRVGIAISTVITLGIAALVVFFIGLGIAIYATARARAAAETVVLERENKMLRMVTEQVTERLPQSRVLALNSDLTFAQLWSKSGLGPAPDIFGVGPLDDDPSGSTQNSAAPTLGMKPISSQISSLQPIELPLEFERLEVEGQALQTSLGEMLEYFHDASLLLSNTPSVRPVVHGFLTSNFGRRNDPMDHSWVMHKGLDIGGPIGTDIIAPADGVVIFTGIRGGYGLTLVIDHGYAMQTHYGHLSRIRVKQGDHVRRGEVVAAVGSTGRSTGPHLHYEVRRTGEPLNPEHFILD